MNWIKIIGPESTYDYVSAGSTCPDFFV